MNFLSRSRPLTWALLRGTRSCLVRKQTTNVTKDVPKPILIRKAKSESTKVLYTWNLIILLAKFLLLNIVYHFN